MQSIKEAKESRKEGAARELCAEARLLQAGYQVFSSRVSDPVDVLTGVHPYYFRIQVKKLIYRPKSTKSAQSKERWEIRARSMRNRSKYVYTAKDVDLIMAISECKKEFALIPISQVPKNGLVRISRGNLNYKYFNTYVALNNFLIGARKFKRL
ncbi:MAG TPA: hypothetical protein PKL77_08925 [Candidatus Omnitrophota bacterium]|nr:hypothetical protein [Candidatus Omnitrophota bacterium]